MARLPAPATKAPDLACRRGSAVFYSPRVKLDLFGIDLEPPK
jgi:hypothetical protein